MNSKIILDEWKKSISKLDKLRIDDAKALYKDIENEKDLVLKKDKFSKLIEGTLYVVANYISSDDFCFLNSTSFDMNDIISVFNETWIEKLMEGRLLEVNFFSLIFDNYFYSIVSDKLLTNKYRIHENLGITSLEFTDILHQYISIKQSNYAFNYGDFKNYIDKNNCLSEKSSKTVKISKLYYLLDNIYSSLIINTENINISKTKTGNLLYLLINDGIEMSSSEISSFTIEDFSNLTDEKIFYKGLQELIFDSKLLNESRKTVLKQRYGLDPYSEPKTYRDISKDIDYSHSRVIVLENNSLDKIRSSKKVMTYLKK